MKRIGTCNRTRTPVYETTTKGYAGYCPELDEDLYDFEFTRLINQKTYTVWYIEENEYHEWTLEEILEQINGNRSESWWDYDEKDWREGWKSWIEGHEYRLIDKE